MRAWQTVARNYPDALVRTMITRYVEDEAFHGWYGRRMLAACDDRIMLYDIFCRVEKCIVGMLLGLNRIYLANTAFKWMDATIAEMALAPADLSTRLKHVFQCPPAEGVVRLEALLDETVALLETHVNGLDLSDFKTRLR